VKFYQLWLKNNLELALKLKTFYLRLQLIHTLDYTAKHFLFYTL